MTMTISNVPNLDAMASPEDLWAFAATIQGVAPRTRAEELFPERPKGFVSVTTSLRNYAHNKAVAMDLRTKGEITAAEIYERICEDIYGRLPEYAKW